MSAEASSGSRRGRPPAAQAELVTPAILEAAGELFLAQGFARTTMDQVIAFAQISKTTLYRRYPDKAALFAAVVEHGCRPLLEATETVSAGGTVRERLVQSGLALAELTLAPESIQLMRITAAEAPTFPVVAQTGFEVGFGACVRCVAVALATDPSSDALRDVTPTAERFVEMALHPLYMHAFFGADLDDVRRRAPAVIAEVADALLGRVDDDTTRTHPGSTA